jgi:pyruvate dehydrogenase E2 component (dihydrolipoamide acetyltransferase)
MTRIRVPDIGDAKDVSVIEIGVSQGDEVSADDLLVVVESDKASMEIPAGQAGTVAAIHVEIGSSVEEGSLLVSLAVSGGGKTGQQKSEKSDKSDKSDKSRKPESASVSAAEDGKSGDAQTERRTSQLDSSSGQSEAEDSRAADVYAGPAVRRLARELGVDLTKVKATGSRGRIVKDDVKAFVKSTLTQPETAAGGGIPRVPEIDFSKFGTVEKVPLTKIRAVGASNLHRSWLNIPHVTQFEEADVTELEEFRRSLKDEAHRRDIKLTPLAFIIKACCYALKTHPAFNSSLDAASKNYLFKKYYNIGFAVDTEQGLVVPVIRDADKLGVWDLSSAIVELAEKARTGKLGMKDMQGGSFSISSLGGIGGTGFTPIINAPEVAILGVSRLVTRPIWDGSKFEPRQMLPLSLSYDHRAINGAEAGRFVVTLAELLADIRRLTL